MSEVRFTAGATRIPTVRRYTRSDLQVDPARSPFLEVCDIFRSYVSKSVFPSASLIPVAKAKHFAATIHTVFRYVWRQPVAITGKSFAMP